MGAIRRDSQMDGPYAFAGVFCCQSPDSVDENRSTRAMATLLCVLSHARPGVGVTHVTWGDRRTQNPRGIGALRWCGLSVCRIDYASLAVVTLPALQKGLSHASARTSHRRMITLGLPILDASCGCTTLKVITDSKNGCT